MILQVPMLDKSTITIDLAKADWAATVDKIDWAALLKMLLTLVPGLLTSIVAKEAYAIKNGFPGPLETYNRCCDGMAAEEAKPK